MKTIYFSFLSLLIAASAFPQQANFYNTSNTGSTVVNLLDNLNAGIQGNSVRLSWSASNEVSMSNHEIQKSANGSSFTTIGTLPAQNNAAPYEYNFADATPVQGINYYRICSYDQNGRVSYSKIIEVNNGYRRTDLEVLSNPVRSGVLNLQLSNFKGGSYNIVLYSNAGEKVFARTMNISDGSLTETINLPLNIAHGLYFLQVTDGLNRINKEVMVQ